MPVRRRISKTRRMKRGGEGFFNSINPFAPKSNEMPRNAMYGRPSAYQMPNISSYANGPAIFNRPASKQQLAEMNDDWATGNRGDYTGVPEMLQRPSTSEQDYTPRQNMLNFPKELIPGMGVSNRRGGSRHKKSKSTKKRSSKRKSAKRG